MTDWIALSDRDSLCLPTGTDAMLRRALLVMELALPLRGTVLLLDHSAADFAISLLYDPDLGFGLMLRHGARLQRHMLHGIRADGSGTAQLHFRWDADRHDWSLTFTGAGITRSSTGAGALPLPCSGLAALCRAGAAPGRAAALLWFGVTPGDAPPKGAPWLGLRLPVATPGGPVAAGALRVGDIVLTRDAGPRQVRALRRADLPGRGSYAPIRLRAPFFLNGTDAIVSADQQLVLSGVEVEYLFGEDEVLVRAQDLVDGSRALVEERAAVLPWIAVDLGEPALIEADGCAFASAAGKGAALRCLERYEAITLQAMRRRGATRSAA